ncbi:MAG: hypothetical protein GXX86_04230 [Propionibacterium sp.]|nr:hypothetical protein [Propionibacterium sp.]
MSRSRVVLAVLTIPLVLVLSGCMRYVVDIGITGGDSTEIEYSMDAGMRNKDAEAEGEEIPDDPCEGAGRTFPDVTLEPYSDDGPDGYTGCRISGTMTAEDLTDSGMTISKSNGVWTFHHEGDSSGSMSGGESPDEMISDFRVSVTFPGEVLSHNGSSTVEGTTVTWTDPADLMTSQGLRAQGRDNVDDIVFEGEVSLDEAKPGGGLGIPPWAIALTVTVLVLAVSWVLIELLIRRKRGNGPPNDPPPPGGPGGPVGSSGTIHRGRGPDWRPPYSAPPAGPGPWQNPQGFGSGPHQPGQQPGPSQPWGWGGPPNQAGQPPSGPDRWAPPPH